MTARELVQYPEAKRLTKKTAEEVLFPSLIDVKLLRLEETCGVCLGDFRDDAVPPSPPPSSGVHTPEEAAEDAVEVIEINDGESETERNAAQGDSADPLRAMGLLTGCTHTYHFFCIEKWGKQRENSCPQCKARFSWIGRYSRSGRRLGCCRVGLKHQRDTAEAAIGDYLQQQQQQLCHICHSLIETGREELRCSDQLCLHVFHFVCVGFDEQPNTMWFCPECRASGICRDAESRRIPSSRISPDGLLLPPRPRARRNAAAAAAEEEQQQEQRERAVIEGLSNAVIRRMNRRARQTQGEDAAAEGGTRRRASRARRGAAAAAAAAASGRRGTRRQQQQEEEEDVTLLEPDGGISSVEIDRRRLGEATAAATAAGPTVLPHPEISSALGPPSEAPRMLRFYLRPENPLAPAARSNSLLLQRKLEIIRLRQERREDLRRQEALRRMEGQARVVCSGVSIESPSGAALVEDLLQHHEQLVRLHSGDRQQTLRPSGPLVTSQVSRQVADGQGESGKEEASGIIATKKQIEEAPAVLPKEERQKREGDTEEAEDGCSILARKCEELLREETERISAVSDDFVRAQILLDIDTARAKFCDEATRVTSGKPQGNSDAAARHSRLGSSGASVAGGAQRREGARGTPLARERPSASASSPPPQEDEAKRSSMRRAERKRKHAKILKPSQALVDQVKSCMMPFMLERYPDRGEEYRAEYKRICRHISEGLTKRHEGPLVSMAEAERRHYWEFNFVQVQTAVQEYFEKDKPSG